MTTPDPAPPEPASPEPAPHPSAPARVAAVVTMLAAGTVAWAALPMTGASRGARPVLIVAACCALLSIAQIVARMLDWARVARPDETYVPRLIELTRRTWQAFVLPPWPQVMIVAVVVLEALHRPRPWHTAVLGLALLAWLLTLHLVETAASPSVLRPQGSLIAAGAGLAGLSAGAAVLPQAGAGSGWVAAIAAVGALLAAALALPV